MFTTHFDLAGNDGDAVAAAKLRRPHTRSRNGCLTCRKRHTRCDEGRPNWYALSEMCRKRLLRRNFSQGSPVPHTKAAYSWELRELLANQTPSCSVNCVSTDRKCEYDTGFIPLRERRLQDKKTLPGQKAPWSVSASTSVFSSALVPASSSSSAPPIPSNLGPAFIDSFETLPIEMVFKSKELFHYCAYYCLPYYQSTFG